MTEHTIQFFFYGGALAHESEFTTPEELTSFALGLTSGAPQVEEEA